MRDMRQNNKVKKLRGMTLIEVIVGMTIILIVTIIAYMGVSAGANFLQRGNDLRNSDSAAASNVQSAVKSRTAAEDVVVHYDYEIRTKETTVVYKIKEAEDGSQVTVTEHAAVTQAGGQPVYIASSETLEGVAGEAVKVVGTDEQVRYVMYLPCVTTVPPAEEHP